MLRRILVLEYKLEINPIAEVGHRECIICTGDIEGEDVLTVTRQDNKGKRTYYFHVSCAEVSLCIAALDAVRKRMR